jgi:predicted nucleic acid-binding Zn ribbon protein
MWNNDCAFCGGRIRTMGDYGNRFCSDDCRYKFNNAQRKYKNKVAKIAELVTELIDVSIQDTELSIVALDALRQIEALSSSGLDQWQFKCRKCERYDYKYHGTASCPDCQSSSWQPIPPKKRPEYL